MEQKEVDFKACVENERSWNPGAVDAF